MKDIKEVCEGAASHLDFLIEGVMPKIIFIESDGKITLRQEGSADKVFIHSGGTREQLYESFLSQIFRAALNSI